MVGPIHVIQSVLQEELKEEGLLLSFMHLPTKGEGDGWMKGDQHSSRLQPRAVYK